MVSISIFANVFICDSKSVLEVIKFKLKPSSILVIIERRRFHQHSQCKLLRDTVLPEGVKSIPSKWIIVSMKFGILRLFSISIVRGTVHVYSIFYHQIRFDTIISLDFTSTTKPAFKRYLSNHNDVLSRNITSIWIFSEMLIFVEQTTNWQECYQS